MHYIILDTLLSGLPLLPLVLGVYLVFRIRDDFDLTIEGSFALGAAVTSVLLLDGVHPVLATASGAVAGVLAGLVTSGIHTLLGVPVLLAGLVMSIGLFSVTLRVLSTPTVGLSRADTIFSVLTPGDRVTDESRIVALVCLVAAVLGAFALFLRTDAGLALRASGVNPLVVRSVGVSERTMLVVSLCTANGLSGLSGALVVQTQGFADVNMGIGVFVTGVGAVLLGVMIARPTGSRVLRILAAVVIGGLAYRLVLVAALRFGLPATDLKGVTALTLIIAVAGQRYAGMLGPVLGRLRTGHAHPPSIAVGKGGAR